MRENGPSGKTIEQKQMGSCPAAEILVCQGGTDPPLNPSCRLVRLPRTVAGPSSPRSSTPFSAPGSPKAISLFWISWWHLAAASRSHCVDTVQMSTASTTQSGSAKPGSGRRAATRASMNSVSPRPAAQSGRSTSPSPFWTSSTTAASGCSPTPTVGRSGSTRGGPTSGSTAWPRRDARTPRTPTRSSWRSTCASMIYATRAPLAVSAGVPLIIVSAHLGHEDTSVTAKIYGHLDRTAGQAAAAAMAKMLDCASVHSLRQGLARSTHRSRGSAELPHQCLGACSGEGQHKGLNASWLIQAGVPLTVIQRHLGPRASRPPPTVTAIWTVSRHGWWPMWSATLSRPSRRVRPVSDFYAQFRFNAEFGV